MFVHARGLGWDSDGRTETKHGPVARRSCVVSRCSHVLRPPVRITPSTMVALHRHDPIQSKTQHPKRPVEPSSSGLVHRSRQAHTAKFSTTRCGRPPRAFQEDWACPARPCPVLRPGRQRSCQAPTASAYSGAGTGQRSQHRTAEPTSRGHRHSSPRH